MAARLSDKKRKRIIADYIEIGTYYGVAQKHKIAANTVKRIVTADPETAKKVKQKKEENTADILAHMETKSAQVCALVDLYLTELMKPERLERATPSQLSTVIGTLIDKWTGVKSNENENTGGVIVLAPVLEDEQP